MLSKERKYRIMQLVEETSFVSIRDLTQILHASRSSIMRDLDELETQGLIVRERGGAAAKNVSDITLTSFNEIPVIHKETLHAEEKKAVCAKAAETIRDGDCIFIDSGTTPAYLLPHIINKRIKLVTPSTYLIRKLPDKFCGDIYLLGGEFRRDYDMSSGPQTLAMIRQFNFDHAFFSTNGVNAENGEVYIFEFSIGAVKQEIIKRAAHNHLLIDASKLDVKALCTWAKTDDFQTVYIDHFPADKELPDNFCICDK